jgi:multiple antibiotic resistance protein
MLPDPFPTESLLGAFFLALPALFSIVNPIGSAFLFAELTDGQPAAVRAALCRKIALYSGLTLFGAVCLGGYIAELFGVSLGALRIGGGLVVAAQGWQLLLNSRGSSEGAIIELPIDFTSSEAAYFPMTMPLTVAPGALAVSVALASQRPATSEALLPFFAGMGLAVACVAMLVWIFYRCSLRLMSLLGGIGAHLASRITAFLLVCLGVQIMLTGIESFPFRVVGFAHAR